MEKKKLEKYTSDNPINDELQDRFQRYGFSKRIAQTIIDRKSKESIVFGLFGEWGEGKSSVLNFIDTELKKAPNIITIKFNPWRYHDENQLLIQFFQKLASLLDKKISTGKEKIGDLLSKYGKILSFDIPVVGNISDAIEKTGEVLGQVDIETLKERIENILIASQKRIVIFIDDIDRLDKNEIHSIFRLVKLTADFSNTVYILSFDKEMVSAAIGSRFGEGDKKAGENFLEKIIQIPISLPKAQTSALRVYTIELLNNALDSNGIDIPKDDANRFIKEFQGAILSEIKTPRMSVRYSNAVSFAVPLLYGEVNIVDLMLIEAVKVFFPSYYDFIKKNPSVFLRGSLKDDLILIKSPNQSDKEAISTLFKTIDTRLGEKQLESLKELLSELFPKLQSIFSNYSFGNEHYEHWGNQKRICSGRYFERYFSYTVLQGEISDVLFDAFIELVNKSTIEEIELEANEIIEKASIDKFIDKILSHEAILDWESAKKIGLYFAKISSTLPNKSSFLGFGFDTGLKRVVVFISRFLNHNKSQKDYFTYIKKLIDSSENMDFVVEVLHWLRLGEVEDAKLLSEKKVVELNKMVFKKELPFLEAGGDIFSKYSDHALFFIDSWLLHNKTKTKAYVKSFISKDKENVLTFLKILTGTIISSSHPEPYKGDFKERNFNELSNYVSIEFIKSCLNKLYKAKELQAEQVQFSDRMYGPSSDINLARQFFHWYNLSSQLKKQSI